MEWFISVETVLLLTTCLVVLVTAAGIWPKRHVPGVPYLFFMLIVSAHWSLFAGLEHATRNPGYKILFAKIEYFGIQGLIPALFLFALAISRMDVLVPKMVKVGVWGMPVLTLLLGLSNDYHKLVWRGFSFYDNGGHLVYLHGPWFWVQAVYSYILLIASTLLIVYSVWRQPGFSPWRAAQLLAAIVAPWFANIMYVSNLSPAAVDLTPFIFSLSSLLFALNIHQYQVMDIFPFARSTLLDTLPDAIIVVDIRGRIIDLNPAACRFCEISMVEAIGQPASQVLSLWPQLARYIESPMRGQDVTLPTVLKDSQQRYYMVTNSAIYDSRRKVSGWMLVLRDITAQKAAESKAQQLAEVIEQAQETIVITQLDGNISYVNPYFENSTGYQREEVLGQNPRILKSGMQDKEFYRNMWQAIVDGLPWHGHFINKRKDGVLYHEVGTVFPLKNTDGSISSYAAVKHDVTALINAEQALAESERQYRWLNEITQAAISQSDLPAMLQILADRMGELFGADGCIIVLWDEEEDKIYLQASSHDQGQQPALHEDVLSFVKMVLTAREPVIVDDIKESPYFSHELAERATARSGIALPLTADGKKLGVALIYFHASRQFSDAESLVGQRAAGQVALAILKARLLEESQERAKEAETLRQAGAAVTASLDLKETIERILVELNRVVPYDSASALLTHGNEMEIIGAHGFSNRDEIIGLRFAVTANTPNKVVFETRKPYILEDAPAAYAAFRYPPHGFTCGWMGIPLIVRDELIGMLALDSLQPRRFTPTHARLASAFADQVAIALENARLFEETHRLAITDPLTALYNRRYFMQWARQEFTRSRRYRQNLSIIMADIDHFKSINDTHGHLLGDQALQVVARLCRQNLRDSDLIGRYGGEEFIILLPQTPLGQLPIDGIIPGPDIDLPAVMVAERLRLAVLNAPIILDGATINLTISLGVAECDPDSGNIEDVIDAADQALLKAKAQGRNRVVICRETE